MSGRKRKTVVVKRLTSKAPIHGAFIPKYGSMSLMDPLGSQDENYLMGKEEKAQTMVDRFWGQDRDQSDRQVEKMSMFAEDDLSKQTENYYKTQKLHRQWDYEQAQAEMYKSQRQMNFKKIERENYIKLITTSAVSSEDIVNNIWNLNRNQFNNQFGGNPAIRHSIAEDSAHPNNSLLFNASTLTGGSTAQYHDSYQTPSLSVPRTHTNNNNSNNNNNSGPVHMSIHLDGLQQSKAIIDKASYSFKETLRRLNTNSSDVENATQPFATAPPASELSRNGVSSSAEIRAREDAKSKINSFLEKTVKLLHINSSDDDDNNNNNNNRHYSTNNQSRMPDYDVQSGHRITSPGRPNTASGTGRTTGQQQQQQQQQPLTAAAIWETIASSQCRHNDAVDGHPVYKWDQEAMLLAVFNHLDSGSKGYLLLEDITAISHDTYTHSLLKYTVFWCILKKKKWSFFEELFEKASKAHKNNQYFISESLFNYNVNASQSQLTNNSGGIKLAPINSARSNSSNSNNNNNNNNFSNNNGLHSSQNSVQSSVNTTSNTTNNTGPRLTYADWITAAEALSKEFGVRVRHIRSHDEHVKLGANSINGNTAATNSKRATSGSGRNNLNLTNSSAANVAASPNNALGQFRPDDEYMIQRETYLSRVLNVGDVVWGLHAKGCLWLPAVIECIHTNYDHTFNPLGYGHGRGIDDTSTQYSGNQYFPKDSHFNNSNTVQNSQTHGTAYYTYDLRYPITQRELKQCRTMSTSRTLLSLPSSTSHDSSLHPKAIYGERNVCAYAYDLIDQNSSGVVELSRLITCFLSPEFRKIIHTSLALYTIFANSKVRINTTAGGNRGGHGNGMRGSMNQFQRGNSYPAHGVSDNGGSQFSALLPPHNHNRNNNTGSNNNNAANRTDNGTTNAQGDESVASGSVYLIEQSSVDTGELEQLQNENTNNAYSILDKACIPCLLPVFIDTFTSNKQTTSSGGGGVSPPKQTQQQHQQNGDGGSTGGAILTAFNNTPINAPVESATLSPTVEKRIKPKKRLSMEQEDANLRELLLLHGHLPAEIATITTRTSTDFSSVTAAAAAAVAAANSSPNTNTNAASNSAAATNPHIIVGSGTLEDGSAANSGGLEDSDGDGIDWISKLDFLEFCMATVDIIQYSII